MRVIAWGILVATSFTIGLLNVAMDGDLQSTLTLIFIVLLVGISLLRPELSLYLFIFVALIVEQAKLPYGWTKDIPYHTNLNNLYPSLKALSINPMELHFLFIIAGLLIQRVVAKKPWVPIIAGRSLLMYFLAVLFFIALGLYHGGATLPALWEVRGIGYLIVLMLIVPQIIRTREQVNHVLWIIIAAVIFRAVEVVSHFADANFTQEGALMGWGSHEDAGFFGTMLVFVFVMWMLKVKDTKQKMILTAVIPLFGLAIVGSDRRTAYPIIAACLLLLAFMMPREVQRKLLSLGWKMAIPVVLYFGIFWNSNSDSIWLAPVQSVREGIGGADENMAGERYSSNLYRQVENYDLYRMLTIRPVFGYGYGTLIDYALPIPIQWELGFYIPHNQILAVLAKTGIVGFIIFINFYLSVASAVAGCFRRLKEDRYLQAVLILVGAAIVGHLIYSFFDIILTYYRTNVFLGVLFGVTSTIVAIEKIQNRVEPEVRAAAAPGASPVAGWLLAPKETPESSVPA